MTEVVEYRSERGNTAKKMEVVRGGARRCAGCEDSESKMRKCMKQ